MEMGHFWRHKDETRRGIQIEARFEGKIYRLAAQCSFKRTYLEHDHKRRLRSPYRRLSSPYYLIRHDVT